jgi:hypothetical protein
MNRTGKKNWIFMGRRPFFKGMHVAGMVVFGIAAAAVFALVFGILVMLLWNWLMPLIFGLPEITYWQAFGIVILVKLVFGTIGHRHGRKEGGRLRDRFRDWEPNSHDWELAGGPQHWHYWRDYWHDEGKSRFESYVRDREAEEQAGTDAPKQQKEV